MRCVAMMPVRNEARRYLREVLENLTPLVNQVVVLDDCSEDESPQICREFDNVFVFKPFDQPMFHQEYLLRARLFAEAAGFKPGWLLSLDADEILDATPQEFRTLLNRDDVTCYGVPVYDLWSKTHYRSDQYWSGHTRYFPRLMRFDPSRQYHWRKADHHCGSLPIEAKPVTPCNIRLKHLGWMREEDRVAKYERYQEMDPEGRYGWPEQYESILDPDPHLVRY